MSSLYSLLKNAARPFISKYHSIAHGNLEFSYGGSEFKYFFHPYNSAWRNERTVEIPIVEKFLEGVDESEILEIGNVLRHYFPNHSHKVVDLYEKGFGVENLDVVKIPGPARFRRIVAISTIEHVGYDETPRDPAKIARALEVLKGLLLPGGEALISIPVGYNPLLDADIKSGAIGFDQIAYLRRKEQGWGWRESDAKDAWTQRFNQRFQAANALVVGYIKQEP